MKFYPRLKNAGHQQICTCRSDENINNSNERIIPPLEPWDRLVYLEEAVVGLLDAVDPDDGDDEAEDAEPEDQHGVVNMLHLSKQNID